MIVRYLLDNNCRFNHEELNATYWDSRDEDITKSEREYFSNIYEMYDEYLYSPSYREGEESDIIFHKKPEYYNWQNCIYLTQKAFDNNIPDEKLNW